MAVPFRRTSKTKKRMRRTHLKKDARTTVKCSNCGEVIQPHRACTKCGFYKGKNVLNKEEETTSAAKEKAVKEVKKEEVKEEKKSTTKTSSSKKETKSKETK